MYSFNFLLKPSCLQVPVTEQEAWAGPEKIARIILGITEQKIMVLLMINVFLLFVGTFMEALAAIVILTPVLLPVVEKLGVDPVHFGIIMVVNLAIGFVTPPVGVNLFVASGIGGAKNDASDFFRHPFDGHDVAEQCRQGDEEDDGCRRSACVDHAIKKTLQGGAMNADSHFIFLPDQVYLDRATKSGQSVAQEVAEAIKNGELRFWARGLGTAGHRLRPGG